MIKVNNLNKYYNKGKSNEIHVINNTSLVLPNEGLIAFLGQSGSGKTTLINVIAGLDKANGEISYDEATFTNYKANKIDKFRVENIGYVFQNYNLLPDRTVYENLSLALNLIGLRDINQINERIDYVLDELKIKKYKNRLAGNLSGGQMQRVSIARALVKDSKIIICDEPTGNLDSENTIEVMNILKAISKTRLVILVTHDNKNASFYADRIVEIKDGSIISDNDNDSVNSLDTKNSDNIYLLDLEAKEYNNDNLGIKIYTDDGELNDLNITIVKANGNIYLKCDGVNYLTDSSKVKLINDNYKDMSKSEVDSLEFNPKPFNYKKKFSLRPFLNSIKNAWFNFRNVGKKSKWLNSCFVIVGFIMAIAVLVLSSSQTADKSKIPSYSNAYVIQHEYDEADKFKEAYLKALEMGYIDDTLETKLYDLIVNDSLDDTYLTESIAPHHYSYITNEKLKAGSKIPSDNEMVITTRVADGIIKRTKKFMNLDYDSIIGLKLKNGYNGTTYTISGIIESNYLDSFINGYGFMVYNGEYNSYITEWFNSIDDYSCVKYEVVSGSDIKNNDEILVSFDAYASDTLTNKVGNTIDFNGKAKKIVGIYKSLEEIYYHNDADYLSSDIELIKENAPVFGDIPYRLIYKDVELVSGRYPTAKNEILVSEYMKLDTNAKADFDANGYIIVGYYRSSIYNNTFITSKENILSGNLGENTYVSGIVLSKNAKELTDLCKEYGFNVVSYSDHAYQMQVKENKAKLASIISVVGVLFAVVFVYTYFIMRSKMIHRIYEIGVLREIGARKSRMYGSFLAEILVTTTFTTVISYLGLILLFMYANKKIGSLISLFHVSGLFTALGVVMIYLVSIISGLLPIFTLLRKTPAEIVSKYDL